MRNLGNLKPSEIKNILIIPLGSVAEILFTTPAVRLLRNSFPEAKIHFLMEKKFFDLLKGCPFIDESIPYNRSGQGRGKWLNLQLLTALRRRRYDLIIDFQGRGEFFFPLLFSGAKVRIGSNLPGWRGKAYNIKQDVPRFPKHLVLSYLDLVKSLVDRREGQLDLRLCVTEGNHLFEESVPNLRPGSKKKFLITPGGCRAAKVWPMERFAQLVQVLRREDKADVIVAGWNADPDRARVDRIRQLAGVEFSSVYYSGLAELISLIKGIDVCIGNDYGPIHIAAAMGKKVVALFGPSDPRLRHPWGSGHEVLWYKLPCSPCDQAECFKGSEGCMVRIEVAEVLEAIHRF